VPNRRWRAVVSGPYFQACLRTALRLPASEYRILSARYGFVSFQTRLEPYEQRMDRCGAVTLEELRLQVADQGLSSMRRVLGLCAGSYRVMTQQLWPGACCPLHGGIGVQMRQLKELRSNGRAGTWSA